MDRSLAFLCAARVCAAIKHKYKDDVRHKMAGLVWVRGEWVADTRPRSDRATEKGGGSSRGMIHGSD